ncbi:MAG: hypothetical protein DWI57_03965 [Chloroflexi bacterium]|nr:MAG: hypothetical protein DWI57_03965 [Chloroflexota bacterium]
MSDKIINTFQARRKLNEDLAGLATTASEGELLARVRAIAQSYEPLLILSTLTKYLDNSSSQVRGGLGRLATLLPYDETVAVLRKEAANRQNPTLTRLTAALILERFLQAELAPGLMSDLKDPETVVMQSLQEALTESHTNRYILLEYVRQMRQENEQVAHQVLELVARLDATDQPELLRLIAYDRRGGVAQAAVERLGLLRQGAAAQRAAQALHTLQHNLSPDLARLAERTLRKLRFAGVPIQPVALENWRGLLTPSTLDGNQDLWFLRSGADASENVLIGLRINASAGLVDAFGSEAVDPQYMPPARAVGELVSVALTDGTPTVFLEVPVAYAQWRLQQAVESHWRQSQPQPLPEEYTFYNPHLFRGEAAAVPGELQALLASGPALWQKSRPKLAENAATLLRHPALAGWFFQNSQIVDAASRLPRNDEQAFQKTLNDLKRKLFTPQVEEALRVEIQAALLAQAGWLAISGHPQHAQHAVLLAEAFNHIRAAEHPLIGMMLEIGLLLLTKRTGGAGKK